MKHLHLGLSFIFFTVCHDRSLQTQPIFGSMHVVWNKSQKSEKPLIVHTAFLFAENLTSFALCYYLIGLLNRVQTNSKHKRKRMRFGCEQLFLWGSIAWHPKTQLQRRLLLPAKKTTTTKYMPMGTDWYSTFISLRRNTRPEHRNI